MPRFKTTPGDISEATRVPGGFPSGMKTKKSVELEAVKFGIRERAARRVAAGMKTKREKGVSLGKARKKSR